MTTRYHSLTVVLEADMRDDDAEKLLSAIRQLRGVLNVSGEVAGLTTYMAEERARQALGVKLWQVLYPEQGGKS